MTAVLVVLALVGSAPWWSAVGRGTSVGGAADVGAAADARRARGSGRGLLAGSAADTGSRSPGASRRWPWARRSGVEGELDAAVLLELVAAALGAGTPVPRALSTIADAVPGAVGTSLARAAAALALGGSWESAWAGAPPAVRAVGDALEPTVATGASPVPLLRAAAAAARRRRRSAGRAAAGRVGVWLVLPLGLCFLPAFLLLGVVPVVLSIAGRLLG